MISCILIVFLLVITSYLFINSNILEDFDYIQDDYYTVKTTEYLDNNNSKYDLEEQKNTLNGCKMLCLGNKLCTGFTRKIDTDPFDEKETCYLKKIDMSLVDQDDRKKDNKYVSYNRNLNMNAPNIDFPIKKDGIPIYVNDDTIQGCFYECAKDKDCTGYIRLAKSDNKSTCGYIKDINKQGNTQNQDYIFYKKT